MTVAQATGVASIPLGLTVRDAIARSAAYLGERGVEGPRLDAELLLAKVLRLTRLELHLAAERPLARDEIERWRSLVARRGRREPLAYVLGEWGFRRLTLSTDRRALVPRPETEVVVERALELVADVAGPRVLDAGTGTGAIALAIADERSDADVTALDRSNDALTLARENARRIGLVGRVRFEHGDFRERLPRGPYDLVISNPPYVLAEEWPGLAPEIREWEPREALVGGLEVLAALAARARDVLDEDGWLVVETAEQRSEAAVAVVRAVGYADVAARADLAGRPRVVEGRARASRAAT